MASARWIGAPAAQAVQVVMQGELEDRCAVQLALSGKVFEPFKEAGLATECNHVKSGHTGSMPALLSFYKKSYVRGF